MDEQTIIDAKGKKSAFNAVHHKCSICHDDSPRCKTKTECGHFYHSHCLKYRILRKLHSSEFIVNCFVNTCRDQISRSTIISVLNKDEKTCYDTLIFIDRINLVGEKKILFWCYRCREITSRFKPQIDSCSRCKKRMDKLSKLIGTFKLMSFKSKIPPRDKRTFEILSLCLKDCSQQLKRCEECLKWKHKLLTSSMRCQCK